MAYSQDQWPRPGRGEPFLRTRHAGVNNRGPATIAKLTREVNRRNNRTNAKRARMRTRKRTITPV